MHEEKIVHQAGASEKRSCDKTFVARVRDDTLFPSFLLLFSRPRRAEEQENAVENIRFPQEAGELSSLKVGRPLKAFDT